MTMKDGWCLRRAAGNVPFWIGNFLKLQIATDTPLKCWLRHAKTPWQWRMDGASERWLCRMRIAWKWQRWWWHKSDAFHPLLKQWLKRRCQDRCRVVHSSCKILQRCCDGMVHTGVSCKFYDCFLYMNASKTWTGVCSCSWSPCCCFNRFPRGYTFMIHSTTVYLSSIAFVALGWFCAALCCS